MPLTRRDLLKRGALAGAAAALLTDSTAEAAPRESERKLKEGEETYTICPYCAVGCGILIRTNGDVIVNAEGDPGHPINEGALCSKGASVANLRQVYNDEGKPVPNPLRLTRVKYRAPGSDRWEEREWDWALGEIARRVKATRDATFERRDAKGVTVNRTMAIAHLGSAALDNEENYLMVKLMRALGVINMDHHARL